MALKQLAIVQKHGLGVLACCQGGGALSFLGRIGSSRPVWFSS
jgi:hypothetical protein